VVNFAFNEMKLHRLEIKCATDNVGSRAIAEKLGFKHEGTLRDGEWLHDRFVDQELYSLLASGK
jgi:ribosomal-protein-serine acetyltransferase